MKWTWSLAWLALLFACGLREHPLPGARRAPATTPDAAIAEPEDAVAAPPRDAAPGSEPSMPTIDIAGTRVPRDHAIVFIHFGHSNMAGLAQSPESLRDYHFGTVPHLWSYQGGGKFVPAHEPTAPDPPVHLGAGPGMAWLRAAAASAGPDYHFISVARARGSAPSTDFMKGGLYYGDFVDRARELKGRVTFAAVFVMLGITDRHLPPAQQGGFTDRMAQIIADLRADLGEPDLPVLHTDYEVEASGDLALDSPTGMMFAPLIRALPGRVRRLALIPTDQIPMMDDHHFDMTGQKLWADRGVQLLIDRGWAPWKK